MKARKAKKKPSASLKKPSKEVPKLMNFKANTEDRKVIAARAKKYAKGNVSLWLRHAAMNYTPKRKDLRP